VWLISDACLVRALGDGSAAEKWLYNPHLTDVDRISIQHLQTAADHWAWAGWGLQLVTAIVLSGGIDSQRAVRRIFVSLGILIAADGILMLLLAVIVR
jgi:hypothetical protein